MPHHAAAVPGPRQSSFEGTFKYSSVLGRVAGQTQRDGPVVHLVADKVEDPSPLQSRRRGSLAIWFDPTMAWKAEPTGRRSRKPGYSDAAIQTCLTMKVLFGIALRQIEPCCATGSSNHGEAASSRACCG